MFSGLSRVTRARTAAVVVFSAGAEQLALLPAKNFSDATVGIPSEKAWKNHLEIPKSDANVSKACRFCKLNSYSQRIGFDTAENEP